MSQRTQRRLPTHVAVTAGVLLAIPVLALLLVGLYADEDPHLWGFPFFYWYQFAWVFLASVFTYAAHWLIERTRAGRGGGSAAGPGRADDATRGDRS